MADYCLRPFQSSLNLHQALQNMPLPPKISEVMNINVDFVKYLIFFDLLDLLE
jgi:hypothetical protein